MSDSRWVEELSRAMQASLAEFGMPSEEIHTLAVDLAPWNGHLQLSLLTRIEAKADPALGASEEMAAWENFAFSESLHGWKAVEELARLMHDAYADSADPPAVARAYFDACAQALAVAFPLPCSFQVLLAHPDTGEEFYRLIV